MSVDADNLQLAVRFALLTTRAITVCPFHPDVIIRVGDDCAETHAYYRARNIVKSDGSRWDHDDLMDEIARQLVHAADGECPGVPNSSDLVIDRPNTVSHASRSQREWARCLLDWRLCCKTPDSSEETAKGRERRRSDGGAAAERWKGSIGRTQKHVEKLSQEAAQGRVRDRRKY
ncbi:hypothetical protein ACRQ5Q_41020 (plasmid) [Bradyrhizobium sp. PMVTL-01]|uniref:hypothetical protein n=1 Tax=Bradyrhizobium sp. PMVTL-01 TaxID=3434999 RepID=UPI003F71DC30